MSNYITTYTRRHFDPVNPEPADMDIKDIAHALSEEMDMSVLSGL